MSVAWFWLAIAALLLLLLCTRVGVRAALDGEGVFHLDLRVGPVRVRLLPAGKKKAKQPKEAHEKPANPKKPKKPEKETKKLSFTLEDGKDALRTLLPALKRALGRTRRGIRIQPLRLSLTLGGREDPAAAAQLYGELQAAVWTGMPLAEKLLDIRDPYLHTGVDFEASAPAAEGEVGITLRIGTLLAVGFGLAFPALGWFLRWRKRCKHRPPKPEKRPPCPQEETG